MNVLVVGGAGYIGSHTVNLLKNQGHNPVIYDDFSIEWKKFKKSYPRFIDVSSDQDMKDDGNYYTLIEKSLENIEKIETNHGIEKGLSKTKLVKKYLKHRGIDDPDKKKILIKVLKESE